MNSYARQLKAFRSRLVRNHFLSSIARFKDKNVYFYHSGGEVSMCTLLRTGANDSFFSEYLPVLNIHCIKLNFVP